MEDHKAKHKHAGPSVQNLRSKQREVQVEIRKNKRGRKFNSKRVRLEETERGEECLPISLEETEKACMDLVNRGENTKECLLKLRRAFTQGPDFVGVIFKVDNCLQSLVGILTGTQIELQEQVAWCLTNAATGHPEHVLALAKAAAPYCIAYVSGSSPLLQDQCAWALGNIAGDAACVSLLHSMGCLPPLIKLLESTTPACVRSAAFAISNLIKDDEEYPKDAVKHGVVPVLKNLLQKTDLTPDLLSEISWVVTYLSSSFTASVQLLDMGFLPIVVDIIVHIAMTGQVEGGEVVTPMLRTLGNLCGHDGYSLTACDNPCLMTALLKLLESPLSHIAKETAWVLTNMTCEYSVSQSVVHGPMLRVLLDMLDKEHDIRSEAMHTLCNIACHGMTGSVALVSHGAVAKVVPLLKHFDMETLHLALTFSERVLYNSDEARFMFEECGGLTNLEQLENYPNNFIRDQAREIIDTYFEDDAEDYYDNL